MRPSPPPPLPVKNISADFLADFVLGLENNSVDFLKPVGFIKFEYILCKDKLCD